MDYDAAWTRLFGQVVMVEDLVRLAVPDLADWLDFRGLEEVGTRWALPKQSEEVLRVHGYSPRTGDRGWRVPYGDGSERSLVVPTEFQSDAHPEMDFRSREYGLLAYQAERRRKPDGDGGVRVLPLVIYSGRRNWSARRPVWGARSAEVTAGGEVLLPLGACCILLDADTHGREDSSGTGAKPTGNLVSSLLALNVERDPQELLARLVRMASSLRTRLRPAAASVAIKELLDWTTVCMADMMSPEMVVQARQVLLQEENERMMALARTAQEWKRAWDAEGRTEELREMLAAGFARVLAEADALELAAARAEGQATLLRVQMVTKFGEDAAATAMARLEDVFDPGTLERVGRWIVECDSAAELLRRLEGVSGRS